MRRMYTLGSRVPAFAKQTASFGQNVLYIARLTLYGHQVPACTSVGEKRSLTQALCLSAFCLRAAFWLC